MENRLDNKSRSLANEEERAQQIDRLAAELDQKHPLERKVKFLLDIRGYLYLNRIAGNYIEFGCFTGELQYAAYRILHKTGTISRYVGLDTFEGEPPLNEVEAEAMPVTQAGDFACSYEAVQKFIEGHLDGAGALVKGDFREAEVLARCDAHAPFNVSVVDCNLLSSIAASLRYSFRNMAPGGVLFVDDYLSNFGQGVPRIPDLVDQLAYEADKRLIRHQFYPPFAQSFVVCAK